jgi:hypothetical protein
LPTNFRPVLRAVAAAGGSGKCTASRFIQGRQIQDSTVKTAFPVAEL